MPEGPHGRRARLPERGGQPVLPLVVAGWKLRGSRGRPARCRGPPPASCEAGTHPPEFGRPGGAPGEPLRRRDERSCSRKGRTSPRARLRARTPDTRDPYRYPARRRDVTAFVPRQTSCLSVLRGEKIPPKLGPVNSVKGWPHERGPAPDRRHAFAAPFRSPTARCHPA